MSTTTQVKTCLEIARAIVLQAGTEGRLLGGHDEPRNRNALLWTGMAKWTPFENAWKDSFMGWLKLADAWNERHPGSVLGADAYHGEVWGLQGRALLDWLNGVLGPNICPSVMDEAIRACFVAQGYPDEGVRA
jgi:hypothetical protein